MGDGDFAAPAKERLRSIGEWMKINGEAIYATHPFKVAKEEIDGDAKQNTDSMIKVGPVTNTMADALNDKTSKNIFPEIRFTGKGDTLYVFAEDIKDKQISLYSLGESGFRKIRKISLLGATGSLAAKQFFVNH